MDPHYENNQFQILESQPVIISIQESIVEGGSTFTEGDGAAGVIGTGLGGVGSACAICGNAALGLVGTVGPVERSGSMTPALAREGPFAPEAINVDDWACSISSLY